MILTYILLFLYLVGHKQTFRYSNCFTVWIILSFFDCILDNLMTVSTLKYITLCFSPSFFLLLWARLLSFFSFSLSFMALFLFLLLCSFLPYFLFFFFFFLFIFLSNCWSKYFDLNCCSNWKLLINFHGVQIGFNRNLRSITLLLFDAAYCLSFHMLFKYLLLALLLHTIFLLYVWRLY